MRAPKSLRDLLLTHELIFIALIILAVAGGGYGILLWDKAAKESQRIGLLIQEIQQTRGDLYRQMKELYDATFLDDADARNEYNGYTQSILTHFANLKKLAVGDQEQQAIADVASNYQAFVNEAPAQFYRYQAAPSETSRKSLYQDMETTIFASYEAVSKRAEDLLIEKQTELKTRLDDAKKTTKILLAIPILLAGLLLVLSRRLLKREIVKPINAMMLATSEISAGNLNHKVPTTGAAELATLSNEINKMAEDLSSSRDALVQTEKQAALGLLVPMLAHNIRNPLASIRATAQVIEVPADDIDNQESIQGIINTVDRLERWTTSLLAYLHPTKPLLNAFEMPKIVENALKPLRQKMVEKNIVFSQKIEISTTVLTDEHLLEQTLYNLMLNAIEASPNGSHINLMAQVENDRLTIAITDQGSGMPFTPNPRAISPAPSTKRFGTGLGIPFAQKACAVLGGDITFAPAQTSDPNHVNGTRVTIQLPQ